MTQFASINKEGLLGDLARVHQKGVQHTLQLEECKIVASHCGSYIHRCYSACSNNVVTKRPALLNRGCDCGTTLAHIEK